VNRANSPEARPAGIEVEFWVDEKPSHPIADKQAEHGPDHGEDDAGFGWIVVVVIVPFFRGFGRIVSGNDKKDPCKRCQNDQSAVRTKWIIAAGNGHC
jgi:hypothetical protein